MWSLKGAVADIARCMSPTISMARILQKLMVNFSTVALFNILMQNFYKVTQGNHEKLPSFATRLEGTLLQIRLQCPGRIANQEVLQHLKDCLFHGVCKPLIPNSWSLPAKWRAKTKKPVTRWGNAQGSKDSQGDTSNRKDPSSLQWFRCQGWGHMAQECAPSEDFKPIWGNQGNAAQPPLAPAATANSRPPALPPWPWTKTNHTDNGSKERATRGCPCFLFSTLTLSLI